MSNKLNIPDQVDEFELEDDELEEFEGEDDGAEEITDEVIWSDILSGKELSKVKSIDLYIAELRKYKFLSHEEQIALWKEGTPEAREKIVQSFLPMVVSIVFKMFGGTLVRNVDMMDLIQAGNKGLVVAANRFDIKKGTRFTTYATYWIRQSVVAEMAELNNFGMRKTAYIINGIKTIIKIEDMLEAALGRHPTKEEVRMALIDVMQDARFENFYEAKELKLPLSLNRNLTEDGDEEGILLDVVETEEEPVYADIERNDTRNILAQAVEDVLSDKERLIVEASFGLGEFRGHELSNTEIAGLLVERGFNEKKCSKQAVNHLKKSALNKMARIPAVKELAI